MIKSDSFISQLSIFVVVSWICKPETRLGSVSFEEICHHPWFADIDWEKLYNKQVIPPFKPNVKSAEDVENVDREFLAEMPAVTPIFDGKCSN